MKVGNREERKRKQGGSMGECCMCLHDSNTPTTHIQVQMKAHNMLYMYMSTCVMDVGE